jgi:polysaccharide deacetylase family protein (PEP-CTERM system associated)
MINVLTIDVEDWYMDIDIKYWGSYEDRVAQSTRKALDILDETNAKATFFVLGYVAEHFPELVEDIRRRGHEIATHGYSHKPITRQSPPEFEEDLLKSIGILERITGERVLGHRASNFTVMERTSWAIDIMKRDGLRYDSSVFPVRTHTYGVPDAPLFPYRISSSNIKVDAPGEGFLELPLSVYRIPMIRKNIPIAGGFYLRFFPYSFIRHGIKKINNLNQPAICYLHPWELDPEQPKLRSLGWTHYRGLAKTEGKFRKLLEDFKFTSIKEAFRLE